VDVELEEEARRILEEKLFGLLMEDEVLVVLSVTPQHENFLV
jgi:hypothetical protein